ncbi:MAG: O-methyltransferase [Aestuariivirgaceae bacterium]
METNWAQIDRYLSNAVIPEDSILEHALAAADRAGLPAIQVSPLQGKLLMLLAQMVGAHRILEIGTLAGYSTIWLGRALPAHGKLITLEVDSKHAEVSRSNIALANLADRVELRLGRALDSLAKLAEENVAPFDMFFIDADKKNIPAYFAWCVRFSRPGSVIVVDNVVRDGAVIDPQAQEAGIQGIRRFFEMAAADRRITGTALQTVGIKGHDGLAIFRVAV